MMQGQKYRQFYDDSPSDIALSSWDCEDLLDAVNDNRLSPTALLRFKQLYRQHSLQICVVPLVTFPFAFAINKWMVAFSSRGLASSRFNFIGMALIWPVAMYFGYTKPLPRKYYTELLADTGDDGNYIRDCVAYYKPGLWKVISNQLEDLNLNFKQNVNGAETLQFEGSYLSSRSFIV